MAAAVSNGMLGREQVEWSGESGGKVSGSSIAADER